MKYIIGIYDGSFSGDQRELADWDEAVSLAGDLSDDTGLAYGIWRMGVEAQESLFGQAFPVTTLLAIVWQQEVFKKE